MNGCDFFVAVWDLGLPIIHCVGIFHPVVIAAAVTMSLNILGNVDANWHRPHGNGANSCNLALSRMDMGDTATAGVLRHDLGLPECNADGDGVESYTLENQLSAI